MAAPPVTLKAAVAALEELANWDSESIDTALRAALAEGPGLKPRTSFGPVRAAVTGRRVSPPLFQSIEPLGRERTWGRLNRALDSLG